MSRKSPGCLKYGCFGCVGVVALFFGFIFLVTATRFASSSEPEPVQASAEQVLPAAPAMPPGDFAADGPETIEIDGEPGLPAAPAQGGKLVLDVSMAELIVRPGPADQPLQVRGDFDGANYELKEEYRQDDDGSWIYEVSFGGKGGFFGVIFGGSGQNVGNEIEIIVPRGHPFSLQGDMGLGETRIDLSGLWVQDVDLEFGAGDHFIEVREPAPFPMGSFQVESSMGEMEIRGLGDASPKSVDVEHGMGALFLDLQGAWRQDADAKVRFSMGECRVWVPEQARVDLKRGNVSMGERVSRLPDYSELPDDAPTVALDVRGSMGEMRVEY